MNLMELIKLKLLMMKLMQFRWLMELNQLMPLTRLIEAETFVQAEAPNEAQVDEAEAACETDIAATSLSEAANVCGCDEIDVIGFSSAAVAVVLAVGNVLRVVSVPVVSAPVVDVPVVAVRVV